MTHHRSNNRQRKRKGGRSSLTTTHAGEGLGKGVWRGWEFPTLKEARAKGYSKGERGLFPVLIFGKWGHLGSRERDASEMLVVVYISGEGEHQKHQSLPLFRYNRGPRPRGVTRRPRRERFWGLVEADELRRPYGLGNLKVFWAQDQNQGGGGSGSQTGERGSSYAGRGLTRKKPSGRGRAQPGARPRASPAPGPPPTGASGEERRAGPRRPQRECPRARGRGRGPGTSAPGGANEWGTQHTQHSSRERARSARTRHIPSRLERGAAEGPGVALSADVHPPALTQPRDARPSPARGGGGARRGRPGS